MYKEFKDETTGMVYIIRLSDGAMILSDPNNRDYAAYLEWQANQAA